MLSEIKSEERCFHTEHACANGNLGPNNVTKYISIIRVMFVTMATGRTEAPPVRLTCKTFVPVQIRPATRASPAEFETMRQVLDRVNQWLHLTGINVNKCSSWGAFHDQVFILSRQTDRQTDNFI